MVSLPPISMEPEREVLRATPSHSEVTSEPPRGAWHKAYAAHEAAHALFGQRAEALERLSSRMSFARLLVMVLVVLILVLGFRDRATGAGWIVAAGIAVFVATVVVHHWVLARQSEATVRRDIHERHMQRVSEEWMKLPVSPSLLPEDHDYAADIDLAGPGSLLQRIDTTHTLWGERALEAWLAAAAPIETIKARQEAVEELSETIELRQELEAAALDGGKTTCGQKISGERFVEMVERPPIIVGWRRAAAITCPLLAVSLVVSFWSGIGRHPLLWLLLTPQIVMVASSWKIVTARFDLLDARRAQLEAFGQMLSVVERATFRAPLLRELGGRLLVGGRPPSHHMAVLARRAGWADLRFQTLVHPIMNLVFMWDWHVLWALERWQQSVGLRVRRWLETLGEIEALSSLSVLRALDETCFPTIVAPEEGFAAADLGHPIIGQARRVANDVRLGGPGNVLVVTGSNMAGKSTLLRAIGLNIALALAGGPVSARSMSVPVVRLRSSMRVSDSLQSGASYFYAELVKLKAVVRDADLSPPVFFLFDELLRGTNAAARRTGATSVVLHLLAQGAMGVVATHDDALSMLAETLGVQATNVHMTDVFVDGEMVFDYRLRSGRATTSNALHLLERAGIPLPPVEPRSEPPGKSRL